ncbi:MerR family transcriptional regulator [Vibrio sp. T187]|uniref:MerR family transcriptional regulator n=1 Tax=Vibrio TaxID=662 RepID=UPI0010C97006|nr:MULTISPECIES: MerR family transcriptional regulator [Vibrio]MBW3698475.1 MerR family transcriptional regulator [Vibrio sp. T187]
MYRISELAALVGLSRSTLLYYGKLGLINSTRQSNGYRSFSERDLQRVRLLQQLQAGGLTLKECQVCLDEKVDRSMLESRLKQLDEEIEKKRRSRDLLAAMLGSGGMKEWHESADKIAPDAHLDWLMKQGFDEKQALRLKWLSKDMNEHEQYMADFERIFDGLERLGPGTPQDTEHALSHLPFSPQSLLEIGCGKGFATQVIVSQLNCVMTAIDNDAPALEALKLRLTELGLERKVQTVCASMTDLPFENTSFDVIWSEGSAYIMGVKQAMQQWKRYLNAGGVLVVNDLVWSTETPSQSALEFWQKEYPDMTTATERIQQAKALGYQVVSQFPLSREGWDAYYQPLKERLKTLEPDMGNSAAYQDMKREVENYFTTQKEYDYQFFVLRKA